MDPCDGMDVAGQGPLPATIVGEDRGRVAASPRCKGHGNYFLFPFVSETSACSIYETANACATNDEAVEPSGITEDILHQVS